MILKILLSIITGIITGLLGSYAGADGTSKAIRRIGIPLFLSVFVSIYFRSLYGLFLLLLVIPFIQGYGIPCHNDKGSKLGSFWYNLIKKYKLNYKEIEVQNLASILTRATIGTIISIILIVLPIINNNWVIYLLISFSIVLIYSTLSWRGLGNFSFFKKELTYSEFYVYFCIGLGVSLLTLF